MGKTTISMTIFNSYVSLPEGTQSLIHSFAGTKYDDPSYIHWAADWLGVNLGRWDVNDSSTKKTFIIGYRFFGIGFY